MRNGDFNVKPVTSDNLIAPCEFFQKLNQT
jgi:hypothetical protein